MKKPKLLFSNIFTIQSQKLLSFGVLAFLLLTLSTCKKKPKGITVTVYDPFMGQPISDAEVSLIEFSWSGGIFNASGNCKIVKSATTDNSGVANLTGGKFKRNNKYNYFLVVSNAYGKPAFYSCANHPTSQYLSETRDAINKTIYYIAREMDWKLNIKGLNSGGFGSLNSDSISVSIYRDFTYIDEFKHNANGSKTLIGTINLSKRFYNSIYAPTTKPEVYTCCEYNYLAKIFPGKYKIEVYKNKGGLVTTYTYSEAAQPVTQYQFNVNW